MNNLELKQKILKRRLRFYKIYTQAKIYGFENPEGFALLETLIEIRKEQDMLIMSLQLEYDRLKKCFENDNINNNTYEYKEEEKQETYEINLPTKQNGRKEKKICKSGKKNGKPKK